MLAHSGTEAVLKAVSAPIKKSPTKVSPSTYRDGCVAVMCGEDTLVGIVIADDEEGLEDDKELLAAPAAL